jgi:hypothetical protein
MTFYYSICPVAVLRLMQLQLLLSPTMEPTPLPNRHPPSIIVGDSMELLPLSLSLSLPSPTTTSSFALFPYRHHKVLLYHRMARRLRWVLWVAGLASTPIRKVRIVSRVLHSYRLSLINVYNRPKQICMAVLYRPEL